MAMIPFCTLALTLLITGCVGENWYSQIALFPPQPDYDLDRRQWEYLAEVRVSTTETGLLTERQQKYIRISAVDRNGTLLLLDELRVRSGYIQIMIEWLTFDSLRVKLLERAGTDVDNNNMVHGETLPTVLSYLWSPEKKQFMKIIDTESPCKRSVPAGPIHP